MVHTPRLAPGHPYHHALITMKPSAAARLLAISLAVYACPAQRVTLPGDTGSIEPSAAWTALQQDELNAASRPTDPTEQKARDQLVALIEELKQADLTDGHAVLHSPGHTPGALRLVHAFGAAGGATTDELLTQAAIDGVRDVLEPELAADQREVTFLEATRTDLSAAGGARLSFRLQGDTGSLRHDHYIFPAGEMLQYFECTSDEADDGALAAFEQLLGTFDGGAEPPPGAGSLWIAGLAGALAGILTALVRRNRQIRHLTENGQQG